jgi:hypothetical protein
MEKYRVTLVPEERAALEQLISRGKSASRKLTHVRILLLADGVREEGNAEDEIATALGTSLKTIARVRKVCRRRIGGGNRSPAANRHVRTRSRSTETWNRSWSSWLARTRPVGDVSAPAIASNQRGESPRRDVLAFRNQR